MEGLAPVFSDGPSHAECQITSAESVSIASNFNGRDSIGSYT
jgi:hypothetical protein